MRNFENRCTICHGGDGAGTDRAPSILSFFVSHIDSEIADFVRKGRIEKGMPAFPFTDNEMKSLIAYVRGLVAGEIKVEAEQGGSRGRGLLEPKPGSFQLGDGGTVQGTIMNEGDFSAEVRTADGRFHLLHRDRREDSFRERPIEPKQDWASYDGSVSGNRYSNLEQVNAQNVARMSLSWFFPIPEAPRLEVTPVVVDGVMYITTVNEVWALNATAGRQIWHWRQPRTQGLLSEAGAGANRGVAVKGDRVFMETDHAHLIALDRRTGEKLWDSKMGDPKDGYSATSAPLVVGDLVVAGLAGGEEGARGFLDAFKADTGEHAWRFYTIPARGEKEAETWQGKWLERGCGATWLTGSYDPNLDLVYWSVGNPCPDYNGDERKGDNLYTSSVVALEAKTGKLKWYKQFTPHDLHDWDSAQPMVLVDQNWEGRPRKLLLHADRNGFFFVLDRTNGELLRATPFVRVTWATGYGKDGRPILTSDNEPTVQGTFACPGYGGTTWMSAAFNPVYNLFYVRASGNCGIFKKSEEEIDVGERTYGGNTDRPPGPPKGSSIKALDIATGKTVWEYPVGNAFDRSGTLATAGGLVFFGQGGGSLVAVHAATGKTLWHADVGQNWWASPMTYMVGGKQYVAIAGPAGIFCFSLPDSLSAPAAP
ncbi:MAG TPA: PQQ-binding-like beta-propeller repeat protein [Bryobacteraceae bacterium]|nr:PQQ-binding-like beta-propeller repeat protein [Bryobacteraceae bacterium]